LIRFVARILLDEDRRVSEIMTGMTLHIPLPEGLDDATVRELDFAAREAIAVRLYRQGKLSHGKLARFLCIGRGQVDELLAAHGVLDEFSAAEIAAQVEALSRLPRRLPR